MRAIRPGLGLPTKYYNDLLGKEVKKISLKELQLIGP